MFSKKLCAMLAMWLSLLILLAACGQDTTNPVTTSVVTTTTANSNASSTATTTNNAATSGGTAGSGTRFEASKCMFKLPSSQTEGKTVNCGYVVVPELHTQPDGKTIKLAVAIFKSSSATPASEPIFYLEGGPGGRVQSIIDLMSSDFARAFTGRNDAVFFDQRGVGNSQPALTCPELVDQSLNDAPLTLTAQVSAQHGLDAAVKCHDRLVGQGVNLAAYTTTENAADINDIRAVLGYQKINLYGGSYGTLLAQYTMRQFPQIVRSVVLDSVVPPDINPDINAIVTASRSFNLVFDACAKDNSCNKNYPDLKNVFAKTFDQLNSKPPLVKVTDTLTGKTFDARADGSSLVGALFVLLYSTEVLGVIPQLLYQIYKGDYSRLGLLLSVPFEEQEQEELGMYFSVTCAEDWAFSQPAEGDAAAKNALPELAKDNDVSTASSFALCQKWGVKKADPVTHTLVQSDIPTLVMEGQFDPVTPPEYGQKVAGSLTHSFYVEFPASGHGEVLPSSPCGLDIMMAFFANPTVKPDSSCTSKLTLKFR